MKQDKLRAGHSEVKGSYAPARSACTSSASSTDPMITNLYHQTLVLDANTLASLGTEISSIERLQAVRDSGLTALKTTLGDANGTFEETVTDIAAAQALIQRYPEKFIKVTHHADLGQARKERKVAVIFSFEAASMLGDKLNRIDLFRDFDVLVMQLGYNHTTPFGVGCLDGETGGVSKLGRAAIDRMNNLGVTLDLSHANIQTTQDGIALSEKPPVFTHSGCRSVFNHPRNKRDEEMKALADKGGVMGIYMLPFLTSDDRQPMLADYMEHLVHALNVCGEDHVGIGTDSIFYAATDEDIAESEREEKDRRKRGVGSPGENRPPYIPDINTPRKLEYVAHALQRRGYSGDVIEKVLGQNFSRVFKETWTN